MLTTRSVVSIFSVAMLVLGASLVYGQNYPSKPIRIMAAEAGGAADFAARIIAPTISGSLGQPVIIDNRVAIIATETAARAAPDGYTLLFIASSFWLGPLLQKASYDPVKDFSPITVVVIESNILVVHPSLPVTSVKELIAMAKARPGELNYANTALGGAIHLAAELFKSMAGVNIVGVPYKGTAAALNAVLAGEVQLMFPAAGVAAPHVKSGRLRALASTRAQPSAMFPELPTMAASGLLGYEAGNTQGLFAPAKTPAAIIGRLNDEIIKVLNRADVKEKFLNYGIEAAGSSPQQFAATIKSDMTRIAKLIKDAGIHIE